VDRSYQQKQGTALDSSVFPVFGNIAMEQFEKLALDTA
jgi:hypothetical protein